MDERWLPIPHYEGLYEVSDQGRVRSLDRMVSRGKHFMRVRGVILQPRVTPRGHIEVVLHADGVAKDHLVHVLVLTVFRGPRPPGKQTRHLNGNPAYNWVTNLKWGTASENAYDRVIHGTHPQARQVSCLREHLLKAPNLVPSALAAGQRQCWACHRAHQAKRSYVKRGVTFDFRAAADGYYAEIMASAA
jgi:hypothetical protein